MTPPDLPLTDLSGTFWRIVWQHGAGAVLDGVSSPEGRLHHSGQSALYLSPRPDWAAMAVNAYLRPDDPPRVLVSLIVASARVADLRNADICAALGITTQTAGIPWQPERQAGHPASSWAASDAVRATHADGLIYPARSYPDRWHVVLHRWNAPGCASVTATGMPEPWTPPA